MDKYSSDAQSITQNINTVFSRLSNPSQYRQLIESKAENLPEDVKQNLSKIKFCDDHIELESPMGSISLGVDNDKTVEPTCVAYGALNSPMAFGLIVELEEVDENTTKAIASIEIDIPVFARMMVAPQLKAAAKKLGEMLANLPYQGVTVACQEEEAKE